VPLHRWLGDAPGAPAEAGFRRLDIEADDWRDLALDIAAGGGRLLALWGTCADGRRGVVHAVAVAPPRALLVSVRLPDGVTSYPGVADIFPAAGRLQRAAYDMTGLRAGDQDTRPWLRHGAWQADVFPLRDAPMPPPVAAPVDDYAFVRVMGDGVHEIPVGPVHAGIIEPGHFRFSVVGEKVLRLEERLG